MLAIPTHLVVGLLRGIGLLAAKAEGAHIWEFPKIRCTILGVLIIGILIYWGLYWGPPI